MYFALAYRSPSRRGRDTPNKDLGAGSGMSKSPEVASHYNTWWFYFVRISKVMAERL